MEGKSYNYVFDVKPSSNKYDVVCVQSIYDQGRFVDSNYKFAGRGYSSLEEARAIAKRENEFWGKGQPLPLKEPQVKPAPYFVDMVISPRIDFYRIP